MQRMRARLPGRNAAAVALAPALLLFPSYSATCADKSGDDGTARATAQLQVEVRIAEQEHDHMSKMNLAAAHLPGGWVRLQAGRSAHAFTGAKHFFLRTTAGGEASFSAGDIRASRREIRRYLARHGILREDSVELVEPAAGFAVRATLLASGAIRARIRPWIRREEDAGHAGKTEILVGAGSVRATARPPSPDAPMRLNIGPRAGGEKTVYIADAETEVIVRPGETFTLAATNDAAREFAAALTARHALVRRRDVLIQLRITRLR